MKVVRLTPAEKAAITQKWRRASAKAQAFELFERLEPLERIEIFAFGARFRKAARAVRVQWNAAVKPAKSVRSEKPLD